MVQYFQKMSIFFPHESLKNLPSKVAHRISANSFRGHYSFLNLALCTVTFGDSTYRCGNYSRKYGTYGSLDYFPAALTAQNSSELIIHIINMSQDICLLICDLNCSFRSLKKLYFLQICSILGLANSSVLTSQFECDTYLIRI